MGLNIPKPPTLLDLYRDYSTTVLSDKERLDRIKALVSGNAHCGGGRGTGGVGLLHPHHSFLSSRSQENQLSLVTGQYLALKRENEALQLRMKKKTRCTISLCMWGQSAARRPHTLESPFVDQGFIQDFQLRGGRQRAGRGGQQL